MEDNELAGVGHNKPPFEEILKDEQREYVDRIDKMLLETGAVTKIDDEVELEAAIAAAKRADKAAKAIEEDRKMRNKEFDDKIVVVNVFFRGLGARAQTERVRLLGLVNGYNAAKEEAERQIAAERAEKLREEARIREEAAKELGGVRGQVLQQESERREKEAEVNVRHATSAPSGPTRTAAGTVSVRKTLKARVKDAGKVPLVKIRAHFKLEHIQKAAEDWGKLTAKNLPEGQMPELPGIEFYHEGTTTLR